MPRSRSRAFVEYLRGIPQQEVTSTNFYNEEFQALGDTTDFVCTYSGTIQQVFLNGVLLDKADYTVADSTVSFSAAPIGTLNITSTTAESAPVSNAGAEPTGSNSAPAGATFAAWDQNNAFASDWAFTGLYEAQRIGTLGPWRTIRGNFYLTSGKWYWEYQTTIANPADPDVFYGAATDATEEATTYPGQNVNSWTYFGGDGSKRNNGNKGDTGLGLVSSGDIVKVAVDLDAGKIWFGRNDTWDGDPAAGTGAAFENVFSPVTPLFANDDTQDTVILNSGASPFQYSLAGFNAGFYSEP